MLFVVEKVQFYNIFAYVLQHKFIKNLYHIFENESS